MEVGVVRRHHPARMWVMLVASLLLLVPLGVLSNVTHSLLLTLEVYHMLYNGLTLGGWLLAFRMGGAPGSPTHTFGWARLEVLTTVMTLLFLAALCFSVCVESVQSLANAAHSDDMHHPVYVMACAAAVLLANLVCYILIGGYTSLQSTLLAPGETDKRLSPAASEAQLRPDSRLALRRPAAPLARHFVRDLGGALLLVVSATTAYLCRAPAVRYLDPSLALLAACLLVVTSRGLFSECCLILLETAPAAFDASAFRTRLLATFPAVQDVHELHVWQLTPDCVVATAHVVLAGPQQFNDVAERVKAFFAAHAVGRVTLQPEFSGTGSRCIKSRCLLPCSVDSCAKSRCCDEPVLRRVPTIRVTPPSQVSLVSSRASATGQTLKEQAGDTVVNGHVRHVSESQGVPESGKAGTVTANGAVGSGGVAGRDRTADVAERPAPPSTVAKTTAPTSYAAVATVPPGDATKKPVPSRSAGDTNAVSGSATEPSVASFGVTTGTPSSSESVTATAPPSEGVPQTQCSSESVLPTDGVTVPSPPHGSVSSVGDWHDAE